MDASVDASGKLGRPKRDNSAGSYAPQALALGYPGKEWGLERGGCSVAGWLIGLGKGTKMGRTWIPDAAEGSVFICLGYGNKIPQAD